MSQLNKTSCCGVREYSGILEFDSVEPMLRDVFIQFYAIGINRGWESGAFILFTCPTGERRLPKIIRYIEENKLGVCTLSPSILNPNSNNNLQCLLFAPNHAKFDTWYKKTKPADVPYEVGDEVRNVNRSSARFGLEAAVFEINVGNETFIPVHVRYADGAIGSGLVTDYTLID